MGKQKGDANYAANIFKSKKEYEKEHEFEKYFHEEVEEEKKIIGTSNFTTRFIADDFKHSASETEAPLSLEQVAIKEKKLSEKQIDQNRKIEEEKIDVLAGLMSAHGITPTLVQHEEIEPEQIKAVEEEEDLSYDISKQFYTQPILRPYDHHIERKEVSFEEQLKEQKKEQAVLNKRKEEVDESYDIFAQFPSQQPVERPYDKHAKLEEQIIVEKPKAKVSESIGKDIAEKPKAESKAKVEKPKTVEKPKASTGVEKPKETKSKAKVIDKPLVVTKVEESEDLAN